MNGVTVSPKPRPIQLASLKVTHVPFSPLAVIVEYQGFLFEVKRPHFSDTNAWRGKYVIRDNEFKDYYAESFAEVGEWVRRITESAVQQSA